MGKLSVNKVKWQKEGKLFCFEVGSSYNRNSLLDYKLNFKILNHTHQVFIYI